MTRILALPLAAALWLGAAASPAAIVPLRLDLKATVDDPPVKGALRTGEARAGPTEWTAPQPLVLPGTVTIQVASDRPLLVAFDIPGWVARDLQLARPVEHVEVHFEPATELRGRLRLPQGSQLRNEGLELLVEQPPHRAVVDRTVILATEPARVWVCPVAEDLAFRCRVPATPGKTDFSVRAAGFLTKFFWARDLIRGATLDLGTLKLARGASIVGWVANAEGPTIPSGASVKLERATGGLRPDPGLGALGTAAVLRDGFFAFEGVAPGSYSIVATAPGFAENRHDGITVVADSESRLRNPLTLHRPVPLVLFIDPPVDTTGNPWRVRLGRDPRWGGHAHAMIEGKADTAGRFSTKAASAGVYSVELLDGVDQAFYRQEHTFSSAMEPVWIQLDLVSIRGKVMVGDQPLPGAELTFSGRSGGRVVIGTGTDANYGATLPHAGRWAVIPASGALGAWVISYVIVPPMGGVVDVQLPGGELGVTVRGPDGKPTGDVAVALVSEQFLPPQRTDSSGRVVIRGLPSGRYIALASTESLSAAPAEASVAGTQEEVELLLKPVLQARPRVRSAAGAVPDAGVLAFSRSAKAPWLFVDSARTDSNGEAAVGVSSVAEGVLWVVQAPGFGLQLAATNRATMNPVLTVGQEAGTLRLRTPSPPKDPSKGDRRRFPALVRPGLGQLPVGILNLWARSHGRTEIAERDSTLLEIPMMEPGSYAYCNLSSYADLLRAQIRGETELTDCAVGTLQAFGELELRLPDGY